VSTLAVVVYGTDKEWWNERTKGCAKRRPGAANRETKERKRKEETTSYASVVPAAAVYGTEMGEWKKNKKGRNEGPAQVSCLTGRPTRRGSTGGRQKNTRAAQAWLLAGQVSEE